MDGSVSATSSAPARSGAARPGLVRNLSAEANVQSILFEQLLNFSAPIVTPPPDDSASSRVEAGDDQVLPDEPEDASPAAEVTEEDSEDQNLEELTTPYLLTHPTEPVQSQVDTECTSKQCELNDSPLETIQNGQAADDSLSIPEANSNPLPTEVDPTPVKAAQKFEEKPHPDQSVTDPNSNTQLGPVDEHHTQRDARKPESEVAPTVPVVEQHHEPVSDAQVVQEQRSDTGSIELIKAAVPVEDQAPSVGRRRSDSSEKWFERAPEESLFSEALQEVEPTADLPSLAADLGPAATELLAGSPSDAPLTTPSGDARSEQSALQVIAPEFSAVTPAATTPASKVVRQIEEPTATVGYLPAGQEAKSGGSKDTKLTPNQEAEKTQLTQQERVRLVQRVARSFNRIDAHGGQINLRLHPEHLGALSLQVRLDGRSLTARLSTETEAARDVLMQELPALRQRLADQGFDVAKFQVEVANNGADSTFGQSSSQSNSGFSSESRQSRPTVDYRRWANTQQPMPQSLTQGPFVSVAPGSGIDLKA